jgi:hypothetical protein
MFTCRVTWEDERWRVVQDPFALKTGEAIAGLGGAKNRMGECWRWKVKAVLRSVNGKDWKCWFER